MKFTLGDIVTGVKGSLYNVTNEKMIEGRVIKFRGDEKFDVRILKHKDEAWNGDIFHDLESKYFSLISTKIEKNEINSKTLTITTSDSKTTLSDGDKTVEINRYYKDKHNQKVSVETVIKKYYDELEREKYEESLPKVGDLVKIVDKGLSFPSYIDWMVENKDSIPYKSGLKWVYGKEIENINAEYQVVVIAKHGEQDRKLALIEMYDDVFIVDVKGLEIVKRG